jgi:hypothetical protein
MEVSGQLHGPAALPPVPIGWEGGWGGSRVGLDAVVLRFIFISVGQLSRYKLTVLYWSLVLPTFWLSYRLTEIAAWPQLITRFDVLFSYRQTLSPYLTAIIFHFHIWSIISTRLLIFREEHLYVTDWLTDQPTNQPTNQSCGRLLLQKLTVTQLVKKLPTFHGTRRFITVITTARHWSLSWANESSPHLPTLVP